MYNCKIIDYGSEKQYRFYKRVIKSSGECPEDLKSEFDSSDKSSKKKKIEDSKEDVRSVDSERSIKSSMARTVNTVYEYARSNQWEYFVTLTFNLKKVDRYDFDECVKKMKIFLDFIRRSNPDMKYVLVPEMHKDGAYHFHGLFSNIPNVEKKDSGRYSFGKYVYAKEKIPSGMLDKCRLIYNMGSYNWGYSDIQLVEHSERAANYLIKYITKELVQATPNKKRYWCSRNLERPVKEELLLMPDEVEVLKTFLREKSIYEKIEKVEAYDYKNEVTYIEIKN